MSIFCCLNKGNCCEVEEMDPTTGFGAPLPVILSIRSNRQPPVSSPGNDRDGGGGGGRGHDRGYNHDHNIPLDSPSRSPPLFSTRRRSRHRAPHQYEQEGHRVTRRVADSSEFEHRPHQRMGPGCGLDPIPTRKVQYTGSSAGGGAARNPGQPFGTGR